MHSPHVTIHAKKLNAPHVKSFKKLKHMTVTPGAKGGATVEHHFGPVKDGDPYGPSHPSETHPFSKAKDAAKHVEAMLMGMPGDTDNDGE